MACKHFKIKLEKEDRHFINSEEHNNCVFCLIDEKGPMTQEQVGKYIGLTKMRISQIERQAIKKLRAAGVEYLFYQ